MPLALSGLPGGKSARKEFLLSLRRLRFATIPAQGLPARSSLKMCHRHIFRALRTPHRACRCCGFHLEGLRPLQTSQGFKIPDNRCCLTFKKDDIAYQKKGCCRMSSAASPFFIYRLLECSLGQRCPRGYRDFCPRRPGRAFLPGFRRRTPRRSGFPPRRRKAPAR